MKKIIILGLVMFLGSALLFGGDFYRVESQGKVKLDSFSSQAEFIEVLKKHMAAEEEIKEEVKGVYGLMFFAVAAPRKTVMVGKVEKRIMEFFNFPGNFDFVQEQGDRLFPTKDELVKSASLQDKIKIHGHTEVFILGIDVKNHRMHSISKPNGQRIFLDSWYKE